MKYELWVGKIGHARYSWVLVKATYPYPIKQENGLTSGRSVKVAAHSLWDGQIKISSGFVYLIEQNYTKIICAT